MNKKINLLYIIALVIINIIQVNGQTVTFCYTEPTIVNYSWAPSNGYHAITGWNRKNVVLKLSNPANFGSSGTCPFNLNVVKLTNITTSGISSAGCDIIDLGMDQDLTSQYGSTYNDPGSGSNTAQYSSAQWAALKAWSDASIKNIIIAYQGHANPLSDDYYLGSGTNNNNPNSFTTFGQTIFNGEFGTSSPINQSGSYQGTYSQYGSTDNVFLQDATGDPTGLLDCSNGNVYLADITMMGNYSDGTGNEIKNDEDVFYGNLVCGLANLVVNGPSTNACNFDFSCNPSNPADDCDGDGVLNGSDPSPVDACVPAQSAGFTGYDSSSDLWTAADCDGDGITNGDEHGSSDPYDICDPNPTDSSCSSCNAGSAAPSFN